MLSLLFSAFLFFTPQGGSIKGKVVADIPDQRRVLPGVPVNLSFSAKQFDGDIFGNSGAPYQITPDRNFGGWFDRQHRESRRYELLEVYNFHPQSWRGSHAFKAGLNFSHTSFEGTDRSIRSRSCARTARVIS